MSPAAGGDLVQRLFERLSAAVDGDYEPLTIGDVYQRLIPYRSVRSEVGVMELATYEHALLSLLGGEGGYLEVELESAAADIRRELGSPNPILGIYRDYADVRIRITGAPSGVSRDAASESNTDLAIARDDGEPVAAGGLGTPPREAAVGSAAPNGGAVDSEFEAPASSSTAADAPPSDPGALCRGCSAPLPAVDGARFCPFCGRMRDPVPCDSCGTLIQPAWNFCIRCGSPARS